MPPDKRRTLGALGERLACEHLERNGYEVLERNFRCRAGELDLIAASETALVFCEVKTHVAGNRRGPPSGLDAIGPMKRRRLRRLAVEWLHAREGPRPRRAWLRFDAIGVTVDRTGRVVALEHLEEAF